MYEGEWANGHRDGEGKPTRADESTAEGSWAAGVLDVLVTSRTGGAEYRVPSSVQTAAARKPSRTAAAHEGVISDDRSPRRRPFEGPGGASYVGQREASAAASATAASGC